MSISFDTPEGIEFYRMTVIASAAALYINTGMKANRAYTPTRMRNALNEVTGSKAKNLKEALRAYVAAAEVAGRPITNPTILKAVSA